MSHIGIRELHKWACKRKTVESRDQLKSLWRLC